MRKIFFLGVLASLVFSSNLKVGDEIGHKNFKDQFEKELVITKDTKEIIAVFSKDSGEKVKEFLDNNSGYLKKNSSVYIADMSQVPSFVMSFFMMPKFKKYNYTMGLIADEKKAEYFPQQEDKITVIKLNNFKVEKIDFVDKVK